MLMLNLVNRTYLSKTFISCSNIVDKSEKLYYLQNIIAQPPSVGIVRKQAVKMF